MKKSVIGLIWLLSVLTILFPVGTLITACFGYVFKLISVTAYAVVIAVLSVCAALACRSIPESKATQIILSVITPLSLLNAVFCIYECGRIIVVVCSFIPVVCCCFLSVKHGKPVKLKTVSLVLSAVTAMPIICFSIMVLLLNGFGRDTIVKTVNSPSGKYYAQVIDIDQGALGGDTCVDVYEKSAINAVLFKIEKKPQRVYSGDWGEFENMQIHWKDDDCLVINSVEYEVG